jgi:hypothetical protein
MQLWTEYEGVTIDGAFALRKLLMPEGRSAFFSTSAATGEPTVVRLIECHFDEEEILARWRSLEALNHPNFLKFERFGQTELDGRPVVYAVFEKVDGNLAEVLDQGHLEVKDVAQLGSSLVAALEVLHTHGFIHEHVEPRNIFNVGGVVKMRGDCIREAPEGEEGREAKRRDVRELATVLLQGLTQRQAMEGVPDSALPAPFRNIIRNGLNGTWSLEKIRAVLDENFAPKPAAPPAPLPAATATVVAGQSVARAAAQVPARPEAQVPLPPRKEDRSAGLGRATARRASWETKEALGEGETFPLRSWWVGVGVAALLLLLFAWGLVHAWNSHRNKGAQMAAVSQSAASQQGTANQISSAPALKPAGADVRRASVAASAGSHAGWRVIAFTYNRRTDAEKKASDLAHTHPDLQPAVFTPSGRAPYLVSVGGVMDRETAHAMARRSRSLGLPRDSYAQNYSR